MTISPPLDLRQENQRIDTYGAPKTAGSQGTLRTPASTLRYLPARPTSRKLAACLVVLCLLLSACGGGSDEPSAVASVDASSDTAAASTSSAAPEAATPEQPSDESEESAPSAGGSGPIDDLLGIPVMDEGEFNDYLIDVISEGERLTAECMLAEGFEYTPETPAVIGPSAENNTDTRDYAEQLGFGFIASFEASTFDGTTTLPLNELYIASLSEGERDAYSEALFGVVIKDEDDFIQQFGEDSLTAGTGCKALAIEELGAVFAVMEEFTPQAEDVFFQFDSDPRIVESNETYSQCMADAGYSVPSRDEVRELVWPQLEPLWEGEAMFVELEEQPERYDTSGIWSQFLSGDTFGPHPPLTAEGQAIVDEVKAFEIALALASFDCYEPLAEAEMAVQLEYEQKLVDSIGGEISERLGDD